MWGLAQKLFFRMLRSGEFHLLLSALIIATASITAISIFIERIENTLYDEASTFIAADAKISGSLSIPESWLNAIESTNLDTAQYQGFNAMIFSDDAMRLAQIKAVSDTYPLRGKLDVSLASNTENISVAHGPQKGDVWVAERLLSILNIAVGDTIKIGNTHFNVSQILKKEPDNASSQFGMAPRAMIHMDDVIKTGAVQPGSRVEYALLLAGEQKEIHAFKEKIQTDLGEHFRWLDPKDGNRALSDAVSRAQRFLLLAGSLSVLLSGLAIAIATQQFALKQQAQVALLKSFGLKGKSIQNTYWFILSLLSIIGITLGCLTGWLLHHLILHFLGALIPSDLAQAGPKAFLMGAATGICMLLAFSAPPLMALGKIAPIQILRQQSGRYFAIKASALIGVLTSVGLIAIYSQNLMITLALVAGLALCILVSALLSRFLLNYLKYTHLHLKGFWKLGLANLQRQRTLTGLQIFVFASVVLLLLILIQVRTQLIDNWRPQLDQTPNHFAFNIFNDELEDIKQHFSEANIRPSAFYPMARGRFISANDIAVKELKSGKRQRANYERELNLTWSETLGEDNHIVDGEWWGKNSPDNTAREKEILLVSAEQEYAEGLGLKLGDQLQFSIAGNTVTASLHNIRSVKWDSMNPNFYMIFNKPITEHSIANWITSFYLEPEQKPFLNGLTEQFPTLSLIELDQTLDMVKTVVNRVSMSIEFIMVLVLASSILVLLTSIQASLGERLKESALLRSFGAKRSFVQKVLLVEFSCIGFISGVFAATGAELCLYFIQTRLFNLDYSWNWQIWCLAPLVSTLLIAVAGYAATIRTTYVPPIRALKAQNM